MKETPRPQPMPERIVSLAVELAGLYLMWRIMDGPDPRDLVRDAWRNVRQWLRSQQEDRAAMLEDLERIRDLPETEGET